LIEYKKINLIKFRKINLIELKKLNLIKFREINLIEFHGNERIIYQLAPIRSTFEPTEWPGHWTIARLGKLDSPANKDLDNSFYGHTGNTRLSLTR
jgi:hypothetical protein